MSQGINVVLMFVSANNQVVKALLENEIKDALSLYKRRIVS